MEDYDVNGDWFLMEDENGVKRQVYRFGVDLVINMLFDEYIDKFAGGPSFLDYELSVKDGFVFITERKEPLVSRVSMFLQSLAKEFKGASSVIHPYSIIRFPYKHQSEVVRRIEDAGYTIHENVIQKSDCVIMLNEYEDIV